MSLQLLHNFPMCTHSLGFREKGAHLFLKPMVLLALLYKWDEFWGQSWAWLLATSLTCYMAALFSLQSHLTPCCMVITSSFFPRQKKNPIKKYPLLPQKKPQSTTPKPQTKTQEENKKPTCWLSWITKPTPSCGRNSFLTLMPLTWLSLLSWSQWLLEPPTSRFHCVKYLPVSTTTQPQVLERKVQASKALQTHCWKPMLAMSICRPAGARTSVVDSLLVLQA